MFAQRTVVSVAKELKTFEETVAKGALHQRFEHGLAIGSFHRYQGSEMSSVGYLGLVAGLYDTLRRLGLGLNINCSLNILFFSAR